MLAADLVGEGLVLAVARFSAEQQVERCRGLPGKLDTLFTKAMGSKELLIDQWRVHEVPDMGMLAVDTPDAAHELASAQGQSVRKTRGLDDRLLNFGAFLLVVKRKCCPCTEIGIDLCRKPQLDVVQVEAVLVAMVVMVTFLLIVVMMAEACDFLLHLAKTFLGRVVMEIAVDDGGNP